MSLHRSDSMVKSEQASVSNDFKSSLGTSFIDTIRLYERTTNH
jgi:hypothetical protein